MYSCLTCRQWWTSMHWVIKVVEPIYRLLSFADQQRPATVAGLIGKTYELKHELEDALTDDQDTYDRVMEVVNKRVSMLKNRTYVIAGK